MYGICDYCKENKELYLKEISYNNGGEKIKLKVCSDCIGVFGGFDDNTRSYVPSTHAQKTAINEQKTTAKREISINKVQLKEYAKTRSKKEWTKIVKILNLIFFVIVTVGFAVGGALIFGDMIDETLYVVGAFVGLLVGVLFGGMTISISMMFVEMSENIAGMYEEIKKNR